MPKVVKILFQAMFLNLWIGKEVILCGGAINTPQILQISGIGKADDLKKAKVDCVLNSEGVGYNLQGKILIKPESLI